MGKDIKIDNNPMYRTQKSNVLSKELEQNTRNQSYKKRPKTASKDSRQEEQSTPLHSKKPSNGLRDSKISNSSNSKIEKRGNDSNINDSKRKNLVITQSAINFHSKGSKNVDSTPSSYLKNSTNSSRVKQLKRGSSATTHSNSETKLRP